MKQENRLTNISDKQLKDYLQFLHRKKTGNTSENLLNEIRQIIFIADRATDITIKSIKQHNEFVNL